jgi:hypothetical protein
MDTANYDASKQQIDAMWNGGKIAGLVNLRLRLSTIQPEAHPRNNASLVAHISTLLGLQPSDDPNAGNSGFLARTLFDYQNPARDETGITQQPGQAEVLPAHPTALQTDALAVRSWQIGDIADGVSWSTLGAHLQGRMAAGDYVDLGTGILNLRDVRNGTNIGATATDPQKTLVATQSLDRVALEVRGGLNGLPTKEGVSYRAATSDAGVYGSAINVGDYVKDQAFWSTSGLRLSHRNEDFGSEGTLQTPKVYYIVTGSSGVFLPQFTNKEVGVREILYKDQTIFHVDQITNYANRTIFVHVTETDPATLPLNQVTKNPWSGQNNV